MKYAKKVVILHDFNKLLHMTNIHTFIQPAQHVVLLTHQSPDGDAMGSSLAMYHYIKSLDKEAVRIIKKMPKWKPGEDFNGQAIDYKYTIPVKFKLNK